MLTISNTVSIPEMEIEIQSVRAQGPGGQNVNKVASAIHLRFDIQASSLPDMYKERLVALADHRISKEGVVVIKAREYRSREKNLEAALSRLQALVRSVGVTPRKRKSTRPSRNSRQRRLDRKVQRGRLKELRRKIT